MQGELLSHGPEYSELEVEEMMAEVVSADTEVAEATLVVKAIGTVIEVRIVEVDTDPSALLGCFSSWAAAAALVASFVLQLEPVHRSARSSTRAAMLKAE